MFKGVDPLSTEGSARNGGRYNSPGVTGVLYTSFESGTAIAEVAKGLIARGINPQSYAEGDWWTYELEVPVDAAIDLTDAQVLEHLQISAERLIQSEAEFTRQIGRRAADAGFQAMIAPSAARPGEKNLVVFLGATKRLPVVRSSRPVKFS